MAFSQLPIDSTPGLRRRWQRFSSPFHPLRTRLQQDPRYRLRSYQEVELAARWGFCLDVNRASTDDWLRLPGLSIHQARTLASLSASGVQFHCVEDVAAALDLPPESLQPLAPVLDFRYYAPPLPTLDVNRATLAELCTLPGIEAWAAERILGERRRGPFLNAAQFQARLNVAPDLMAQLIHRLRFGA